MHAEPRAQRLLAIKLADLGDVLLCEPAFRSLRRAFPEARIDVLTTPQSVALLDLIGHELRPISFPKHVFDRPRSLVKPTPLLQAANLARRLRTSRYDRVVVLHHLTTAYGARKFSALARVTGSPVVAGLDNGRGSFLTARVLDRGFGARHEAGYMLDVAVAAGGSRIEPVPAIAVPPSVELPVAPPDTYVVLFPATGPFSEAREWPAERFGQIARRLRSRGMIPVVLGAEDAGDAARKILAEEPLAVDLTGMTSLPQLAAILQRARLAIGGDTFIGHLAAAVGTPVVSIFGPSNADAWRPAGSVDAGTPLTSVGASLVVRHDLPCEPCIYTGFRLGRPQGCADRTCLKLVSIDDVDGAVQRLLGVAC